MKNEELSAQHVLNGADNKPELQLVFTLIPGMDRNNFHFQRRNDVAAVFFATAHGEIPESYVTICNKNTKALQYVSMMDSNVEPWIYPLLYSYGTRGWHSNLQCVTKNRRITRAAYTEEKKTILKEIVDAKYSETCIKFVLFYSLF